MEKQTLSPRLGRNFDLITVADFLLEVDYENRLLLSSYRPSNHVKFPDYPLDGELIAVAINSGTDELKLWEGVHQPGQPKLLIPANLPDVLQASPDAVRQIRVDFGYGIGSEVPHGYLLTKAEAELLSGKKPVTIIAGYPYEVDVIKDTLTPLDKKGPTLAFSNFKVVDCGGDTDTAYMGFFNARTRTLVEPWKFKTSDLLDDIWPITIPRLVKFDPVALAVQQDFKPHHYLTNARHYQPVSDYAIPFSKDAQIRLIKSIAGEIVPVYKIGYAVCFLDGNEIDITINRVLFENLMSKNPQRLLGIEIAKSNLSAGKPATRSAKRRKIKG